MIVGLLPDMWRISRGNASWWRKTCNQKKTYLVALNQFTVKKTIIECLAVNIFNQHWAALQFSLILDDLIKKKKKQQKTNNIIANTNSLDIKRDCSFSSMFHE